MPSTRDLNEHRGEIFAWINSDDLLIPNALRTVSEYFVANPDWKVLVGGCKLIDRNDTEIGNGIRRIDQPVDVTLEDWSAHWFPQQATFWRSDLWHAVGGLDETLHYAMDYDLWFRFSELTSFHSVPEILSSYRYHDDAKCMAQTQRLAEELLRVQMRHLSGDHEVLHRALCNTVRHYESQLSEMRQSWTWRIGAAVTSPLRRTADLVSSLRGIRGPS